MQHMLIVRLMLKGFMAATKILPVWFLRAVGHVCVVFFILFVSFKNFRGIMMNMRRIKPGISTFDAALMAHRVYVSYSYYLIDLYRISHDIKRISEYKIKITGLELMNEAVKSGKGLVLLTTHLGNWELGGLLLPARDSIIHVVYWPDSSDMLEMQRRNIRATGQVVEIALKPGEFSSVKLFRVLEQGGIVALQGDRLQFDSGQSVGFFGSPALFPKGPVKLAMLSGALVVPVFMPMRGYKSYEIIVEKPLEMDASIELKYNLLKITSVFERYISRYPEQWYTFIPFWDEDRGRLKV